MNTLTITREKAYELVKIDGSYVRTIYERDFTTHYATEDEARAALVLYRARNPAPTLGVKLTETRSRAEIICVDKPAPKPTPPNEPGDPAARDTVAAESASSLPHGYTGSDMGHEARGSYSLPPDDIAF